MGITRKGRRCFALVENFRTAALCHLHDPEGTFRKQMRAKGRGEKPPKKIPGVCNHRWYVRPEGIICTRCKKIDTAV